MKKITITLSLLAVFFGLYFLAVNINDEEISIEAKKILDTQEKLHPETEQTLKLLRELKAKDFNISFKFENCYLKSTYVTKKDWPEVYQRISQCNLLKDDYAPDIRKILNGAYEADTNYNIPNYVTVSTLYTIFKYEIIKLNILAHQGKLTRVDEELNILHQFISKSLKEKQLIFSTSILLSMLNNLRDWVKDSRSDGLQVKYVKLAIDLDKNLFKKSTLENEFLFGAHLIQSFNTFSSFYSAAEIDNSEKIENEQDSFFSNFFFKLFLHKNRTINLLYSTYYSPDPKVSDLPLQNIFGKKMLANVFTAYTSRQKLLDKRLDKLNTQD